MPVRSAAFLSSMPVPGLQLNDIDVMRIKVEPFAHPDYEALRKRSEPLSFMWAVGHGFFVVFVAMACAIPFSEVMLRLVDAAILKDRSLEFCGGAGAAALMLAATGLAVRHYARKKGLHANQLSRAT